MTHPGAWVTLTPIEIEFCDQLGIDRQALRRSRFPPHQQSPR